MTNVREAGRRYLGTIAYHVLPPVLALTALLIVWEAWVRLRDVSIFLAPAPSDVWLRFIEDPRFFWGEGGYTLYEATLGLLVGSAAALALAVLISHSSLAERSIFPLAIAIKVTPLVAVAPVLVIMLGFGTTPKVIVAALLCFFPVLVNAMTGFRDVDPKALDFMRSVRASPWQVFWKMRVPSSLPYLFAALKVAYPLALIGAVVAEWFTGDRGLGLVIFVANSKLDTATLFAAIFVLASTGVMLNGLIYLVERRVLHWHESLRTL